MGTTSFTLMTTGTEDFTALAQITEVQTTTETTSRIRVIFELPVTETVMKKKAKIILHQVYDGQLLLILLLGD
jgi:hypothetical protein